MTLAEFFALKRGSQLEFAKAIGIPASLLSAWATGDRKVPTERCPQVERATDGAVTCEELLPAASWVRVKDKDWPHPKGRPLLDLAAKRDTESEAAEAKG